MTLTGSTSDRPKALRPDGENPSMARPNRAEVVVPDEIGVYHCVQRVVRKAFLCGVDSLSGTSYDHRKAWIRGRLESLAELFGVEIAAFALMSNHLHVILRNRPDVVAPWSDSEVARRWLTLFPGRVATQPDPASALAAVAGQSVEEARSLPSGTPSRPPSQQAPGSRRTGVPSRRDGWLNPIELDERAEPLTTAMATPQAAVATTSRSVQVVVLVEPATAAFCR
jgi:hypothetical protein